MTAPALKFCGLTRAEDAATAASLGAAYVGVIFAGGPRLVTPRRAAAIVAAARDAAGRAGLPVPRAVGVFGTQSPAEIAETARAATLDVVQLHADPDAAAVAETRARFDGAVWGVLRLDASTLPPHAAGLFAAADAVVLDAKIAGTTLGGTGVALPWAALVAAVVPHRAAGAALVLAGGLRPENVGEAVRVLLPDVVDVSSGVERAPGLKDHARMRAFAESARAVAPEVLPR